MLTFSVNEDERVCVRFIEFYQFVDLAVAECALKYRIQICLNSGREITACYPTKKHRDRHLKELHRLVDQEKG